MIMLTFPHLDFIIVIMCVVGFYLEYDLAYFFISNKDGHGMRMGAARFPAILNPHLVHRVFAHSHDLNIYFFSAKIIPIRE